MNKTFSLIATLFFLNNTGAIAPCFAQRTATASTVWDTTTLDQTTLNNILEKNRQYYKQGKVADYIPELGKANAKSLALAVVNSNGTVVSAGNIQQKFTIQSISKIIALMIAVQENGEENVFDKMGYFGTDKPFNHFGNLETMGKPLNPMMNAGAILTTSLIKGKGEEPFVKLLKMIRFITKNEHIDYSHAVYNSERETGHRNRGMFYIMRNNGLIDGEGEEKLNNYFKQCSIEITVEDLAKIGYFFAHHCVRYDGNKKYQDPNLSQLIQSQMLIAGMYEFSGEYARTVGLPSKSGVGGGITVSIPGKMGIGAFSPALDQHGNSLAGYRMILDLVKARKLSLFD
ncbi:glutaminase A [Sphingobacterium sp. HMA12]|uniref:glutaminase A n=1 Tax=Sphingobacterium sp. HMA12 TaxID=2050894 RepID=UPI000CEA3060|nr:glutaminase A [Sphingobacterium sp. HMA12]